MLVVFGLEPKKMSKPRKGTNKTSKVCLFSTLSLFVDIKSTCQVIPFVTQLHPLYRLEVAKKTPIFGVRVTCGKTHHPFKAAALLKNPQKLPGLFFFPLCFCQKNRIPDPPTSKPGIVVRKQDVFLCLFFVPEGWGERKTYRGIPKKLEKTHVILGGKKESNPSNGSIEEFHFIPAANRKGWATVRCLCTFLVLLAHGRLWWVGCKFQYWWCKACTSFWIAAISLLSAR